jgi:hypothetical protein
VSAQDDTTTHTVYNMIQRELVVESDVQLRMDKPSSTIDSGQLSTSSYVEDVFGDSGAGTSKTDTSSEGSEMAPQYDPDQGVTPLSCTMRVSEDMIRATTRRIDDMHAVMEDYC